MSQVRYQPLGPLMSGEGSRAFLGLAHEEGAAPRPVVLIWAHEELTQDEEWVDKLRRETERAVVFEHPHILRVYGLVQLEKGLARVTEYADGETLRRVLEVTPRIPPPLAARLVADAAMGAHYAHVAGNDDGTPLVHGDLRPETLMVSFQGVCKVTGYGALGVAPKERGGRRVRNRRKYSAPEQILGGREAVDVKTDVFLLGLVLYECLTGKTPFKDAPDPDTATLSTPLPHLLPHLPRALDAVVQKATAKRAKERYASALALREALEEAVGELPPAEAVSAYMNRLFPPKDAARVARAQVLELGLAEALRRVGAPAPTPAPAAPTAPVPSAAPAPTPGTAGTPADANTAPSSPPARQESPAPAPPSPAPSAAEPPEPAPPSPAPSAAEPPAPAPPRPAPSTPEPPAPERTRARSVLPLTLATLAVLSAAALVVSRGDWGELPHPLEPEDGGTPLALEDGGSAAADGGAVGAGVETVLELIVDPRVDILLSDGGVLGRTPLSVPLPAGRHVLTLSNPALGIQTTRAVTVNPTGRTTHRIYLNKGFVTVQAPEGASVQINGRNLGTAPIEELDLYEGQHRLVVTVGGARWQKSFQLDAQQRVTFTVAFEEPEEELP